MVRKIDSVIFGTKYMPKISKPTCNIKRGLKAASIYAMSTIAAYGILSACTSNKKQAIESIPQKTEQIAAPDTLQAKPQSELAPNGYYVVKDGDNIWNIAEALLKEKGIENPTGPHIDKVKESIMLMNHKEYSSDSCDVVPIHPKDTLWVDPHAYISEQLQNSNVGKYTDEIGNIFIKLATH